MRRDDTRQRGAALVEFAILMPLLLLLILGIIEFGWLFGQFNDVRHGAREGARFAAVNGGTNTEIHQRVCSAMDGLSAGIATLTVELDPDPDGDADESIGEPGSVEVVATVGSLTSVPFIAAFLPDELTSGIEFRLEQEPTSWNADPGPVSVTC